MFGNGFFWDLQIMLMRIFNFHPTGESPTEIQQFVSNYLLEFIPYVLTMLLCLIPVVVIYRLIRLLFMG